MLLNAWWRIELSARGEKSEVNVVRETETESVTVTVSLRGWDEEGGDGWSWSHASHLRERRRGHDSTFTSLTSLLF